MLTEHEFVKYTVFCKTAKPFSSAYTKTLFLNKQYFIICFMQNIVSEIKEINLVYNNK